MINVKIDVETIGNVTFEVPDDIVNVDNAFDACNGRHCSLAEYVVLDLSAKPAALLTVWANASDEANPSPLWSLQAILQDQFLNLMSTEVYTAAGDEFHGVMGLAERTSNDLFLPDGVYSLWARDAANPPDTGELPATNIYGVHPFYMAPARDESWFGVYTNLAAAQDWWLVNDPDNGQVSLTAVATGGLADVTVILGADPNEVTRRYHDLVGKPVLTPMWALGWHQCRWGYTSTAALDDVVTNYEEGKFPLDAQWSDIDYMEEYKDFTIDPDNYGGLPAFVDKLHAKHLHYVPILDAGIA